MNIRFSKMYKNAQNEQNALPQLKPFYAASCYMENVFLKNTVAIKAQRNKQVKIQP